MAVDIINLNGSLYNPFISNTANISFASNPFYRNNKITVNTFLSYIHVNATDSEMSLILDLYLADGFVFPNNYNGFKFKARVSGLPSQYLLDFEESIGDTTVIDANTLDIEYTLSDFNLDTSRKVILSNITDFSNINIDIVYNSVAESIAVIGNQFGYNAFGLGDTISFSKAVDPIEYVNINTKNKDIVDIGNGTYAKFSPEVDTFVISNSEAPELTIQTAIDSSLEINPIIGYTDGSDGSGKIIASNRLIWTNSQWDSAWTESTMSEDMRVLYNSLQYIQDQNRITQLGQGSILFIDTYNDGQYVGVTSLESGGRGIVLSDMCSLLGYQYNTHTMRNATLYSTYYTSDNTLYRNTRVMDLTDAMLDQYSAIVVFSDSSLKAGTTSTQGTLLSEDSSIAIGNYVASGGGLMVVSTSSTETRIQSLDDAKVDEVVYYGGTSTTLYFANLFLTPFGIYVRGRYASSPTIDISDVRTRLGDNPIITGITGSLTFYNPTYIENSGATLVSNTLQYINLPMDAGRNFYRITMNLVAGGTDQKDLIVYRTAPPLNTSGLSGYVFEHTTYDESVPFDITYNSSSSISDFSGEVLLSGDIVFKFSCVAGVLSTAKLFNGNLYISYEDIIEIRYTDPVEYSYTVFCNRHQEDIRSVLNKTKMMALIRRGSWQNTNFKSEYPTASNFNLISNAYPNQLKYNHHYNIEHIRRYMLSTLRKERVYSLLYDDNAVYNSLISGTTITTQEDIFNTWAVFSADEYYDELSLAPAVVPYSTWIYDSVNARIVQTSNTGTYTGFVSVEKISNYELEVTLTSPNGDDDSIGVVIAHKHDAGVNYTISAIVTNGGQLSATDPLVIVYNFNRLDQRVIATSSHDQTFKNPDLTGWSNREMRLKVTRENDNITVIASNWDDVGNYNSLSQISFNLLDNADTANLSGDQSYGYSTMSQADATYKDIVVSGGLNADLIVNYNTQNAAANLDGTIVEGATSLKSVYGSNRVVTNTFTGYSYYISDDAYFSYWGNESEVEVIGKRKIYLSGTFYILGYDSNKTYTITASGAIVTNNGSSFDIDLNGITGSYSFTVSDGTYTTTIDIEGVLSSGDESTTGGTGLYVDPNDELWN